MASSIKYQSMLFILSNNTLQIVQKIDSFQGILKGMIAMMYL